MSKSRLFKSCIVAKSGLGVEGHQMMCLPPHLLKPCDFTPQPCASHQCTTLTTILQSCIDLWPPDVTWKPNWPFRNSLTSRALAFLFWQLTPPVFDKLDPDRHEHPDAVKEGEISDSEGLTRCLTNRKGCEWKRSRGSAFRAARPYVSWCMPFSFLFL